MLGLPSFELAASSPWAGCIEGTRIISARLDVSTLDRVEGFAGSRRGVSPIVRHVGIVDRIIVVLPKL